MFFPWVEQIENPLIAKKTYTQFNCILNPIHNFDICSNNQIVPSNKNQILIHHYVLLICIPNIMYIFTKIWKKCSFGDCNLQNFFLHATSFHLWCHVLGFIFLSLTSISLVADWKCTWKLCLFCWHIVQIIVFAIQICFQPYALKISFNILV